MGESMDLKPRPFCGCGAVRIMMDRDSKNYSAYCPWCGVETMQVFEEQTAKEMWNRRVTHGDEE